MAVDSCSCTLENYWTGNVIRYFPPGLKPDKTWPENPLTPQTEQSPPEDSS